MNILETEWWTMALPPEWWAESEAESILVGDRDDVGCIEISTLQKDGGEFSAAEVLAMAKDNAEQPLDWREVELGDFTGVTASYVDEEDDAALREWYITSGSLLLFITYSCDTENRGMDDAAVNELLDTLLLVQ